MAKRRNPGEYKPDDSGDTYLDEHLEKHPHHAWWAPPHNLMINQALMGINLWEFSIFPFNPKRRMYVPSKNAIVINPKWISIDHGQRVGSMDASGFTHIGTETAKKLVEIAKSRPTIQQTIQHNLDAAEEFFEIKIPQSIRSNLERDAVKVAKRRWGVREPKEILIPLDGSKSRNVTGMERMFGFEK